MTRSFAVALVFRGARDPGSNALGNLGGSVTETVVRACNVFACFAADIALQCQDCCVTPAQTNGKGGGRLTGQPVSRSQSCIHRAREGCGVLGRVGTKSWELDCQESGAERSRPAEKRHNSTTSHKVFTS